MRVLGVDDVLACDADRWLDGQSFMKSMICQVMKGRNDGHDCHIISLDALNNELYFFKRIDEP